MVHASVASARQKSVNALKNRSFKAEPTEVARIVWLVLFGLEIILFTAWIISIAVEGVSWEVQLPITSGIYTPIPGEEHLQWEPRFVGYLPTTSITMITWIFLIIMDGIVGFTWPLESKQDEVVVFLQKRRWISHFFADWPAVVVIAAMVGMTDQPVFVILGASVLPSAYLGYSMVQRNAKQGEYVFSWDTQGVMVFSGLLLWIGLTMEYNAHSVSDLHVSMQIVYVMLTFFGVKYLLFLIPNIANSICCHRRCGLNDAAMRVELTNHLVFVLVRWTIALAILLAAFDQTAAGTVAISADLENAG
jgi:hypothetical protein